MKNIIILSGLLLISCSTKLHVFTDADKDFSVSSTRTYSWVAIPDIEDNNNPLYYNELNDKRIRLKVDGQLSNKGYRKIEGKGDLTIHYHIVVRDYTAYREDPALHHHAAWMRSDIRYYDYLEGTLIIDLMDTKTSSLVWRGYASGILNVNRPEMDEHKFEEAILKIFSEFPRSSN